MPSAVWGLDVGHSSIKAVRLERAGSVAELTNFDIIDIEPGEDDNTRPDRVQVAFEELLKRRRFGQEPVLVAVPGNQTFFRPFGLPQVAASKLPEIVRFEARQQIPFPINEVIWDFKTIAKGEEGETRVGLVAIRRELVEQTLAQIRLLGLNLEAIQVAPLALYNLVNYELGGKEPFLVLDAGARVTDFVVVDGEEFWFRPLPQSGNDFTRSLEQKFRMTFEEAEELKLKMGESKQAQKIFQVIEPMLRNLVGDIQRTIGYYRGIRKEAEFNRVLAFGGTFRLPGLMDFLEQALDMQIEPMDQLRRIRVGQGVDIDWWREEVASMGVALGLGLQGIGLSHVKMEFLPEAVIEQRVLKKKRPAVALGVGLSLLAGLGSLYGAHKDREIAENDQVAITKGLADAKRFKSLYDGVKQPNDLLDAKLEDWAEGTGRERGWIVDAMSGITSLKTASGKPAIGPKAADGNGIHMTALYVSRKDPPRQLGSRRVAQSIHTWYSDVTNVKGASPEPMIAILLGEVAGPIYEGAEVKADPDLLHSKALQEAIEYASKVFLKGASAPEVGKVTETDESKAKDAIVFTPRGGESRQIEKSKIERLIWFRRVVLGSDYYDDPRPPVPKYYHDELVRKVMSNPDAKAPSEMRGYKQISMAWVVDDGSTPVKEKK